MLKKEGMLDDSLLETVSGGNRYSNEKLIACNSCGAFFPEIQLVNGNCKKCNDSKMQSGGISGVKIGQSLIGKA